MKDQQPCPALLILPSPCITGKSSHGSTKLFAHVDFLDPLLGELLNSLNRIHLDSFTLRERERNTILVEFFQQ